MGFFPSGSSAVTLASIAAAMPYVVDSPDFHGAVHDGSTNDQAAFEAAVSNVVTTAISNGSYYGEIWLSSAVYFVSGTLDTSHSGRALIALPNQSDTGQKLILVFRSVAAGGADALAHWLQTVAQHAGAVILSDLNQAYSGTFGGASIIGGPTVEVVGQPNFSNVLVVMDGITFALTSASNNAVALDLQQCAEMRLGNLGFTGNYIPGVAPNPPASQNSIALKTPQRGNNDLLEGGSLTIEGFGIGVVPGEHFNAKRLLTLACNTGMYFLNAMIDTVNIDYWSCEEVKTGIDATSISGDSLHRVFLSVQQWDLESGAELTTHVSDSNNAIYGQATYEYYNGTNTGSAIVKTGGTNFRCKNLATGVVT